MKTITAVLAGLVLMMVPVGLSAQNPDYVLGISDSAGPVGGQATVATVLDMTTASQMILAYDWGVCHDGPVDTVNVQNGADVMALNGGNGPDFVGVEIIPGAGWTVSVLINNNGQDSLPPGGFYEMHLATYDLLADGAATLSYCETLGATLALQCPCSLPIIPTTETGTIEVGVGSPPDFIRGDADSDGVFSGLIDGLYILDFQFGNGPPPPCMEAADADGNGIFSGLVDALYVLVHQFQGGAPPPAPYPECGLAPFPMLLCDDSPGCL